LASELSRCVAIFAKVFIQLDSVLRTIDSLDVRVISFESCWSNLALHWVIGDEVEAAWIGEIQFG